MAFVDPVTLSRDGVTLVPLGFEHEAGLMAAGLADDLWQIQVTMVPGPGEAAGYIQLALDQDDRFAFAVFDEDGVVVGSTSYHDILPGPRRVEIGYTWYARRVQRTHVNTTCKLLLLEHAYGALGCNVVGWRTDRENHASQAAIERLGAKKDGVIRGDKLRRDGVTVRDTVMYSLLATEWPAVRDRLEARLVAGGRSGGSGAGGAGGSGAAGSGGSGGGLPTATATSDSHATRAEAGLGTTIPALPVQDIAAAVEFYGERLGFEALHRSEDFAVLRRDDARLHLWRSDDERWRTRADLVAEPIESGAESFLAGTASCRIETVDVDGLYAELAPRGVLHPNTSGVHDTEFGTREFATLDLEGNLLEFFRWLR